MIYKVEGCLYHGENEGNSDIWHGFEILRVTHPIVLLACPPHYINNLLDILIAEEALPIGLHSAYFLETDECDRALQNLRNILNDKIIPFFKLLCKFVVMLDGTFVLTTHFRIPI